MMVVILVSTFLGKAIWLSDEGNLLSTLEAIVDKSDLDGCLPKAESVFFGLVAIDVLCMPTSMFTVAISPLAVGICAFTELWELASFSECVCAHKKRYLRQRFASMSRD